MGWLTCKSNHYFTEKWKTEMNDRPTTWKKWSPIRLGTGLPDSSTPVVISENLINVKCEMWNEKWGMWSLKCEMDIRMGYEERDVWSVEFISNSTFQTSQFTFLTSHFTFINSHSTFHIPNLLRTAHGIHELRFAPSWEGGMETMTGDVGYHTFVFRRRLVEAPVG